MSEPSSPVYWCEHGKNSAAPPEVLMLQKAKYPFEDMGVGDALFFDSFKAAESARVSSIYFVKVKKPEWRFSTRKNSGGWWIYRVR